ncbi:MAG: hypothetical protein U0Y68_13320 [Blastocatellia bacterium]
MWGRIRIKFVTRGGTNDFKGSVYWYHRNPALNANNWFNNRDLPADPRTGKAPRDRVLLNQPGFRIGGPISIPGLFSGRDRVFFFINYEEFRLPEQQSRQRVIFSPQAQQGIFQYNTATGVASVDLLKLAADGKQTATVDPIIGKLLSDMRASTSKGGVSQSSDPNLQNFSFINTGSTVRKFPTGRFDFNLTSKHHLENIYNYQRFDQSRQFINNADEAFPGFPNFGGSYYDRFSNVTALRSTLSTSLVNEARFGFVGGNARFRPEINPAQFDNQGGFSIGSSAASTTTGFGRAGISNPTAQRVSQLRNTPVKQFSDTVSYVRGAHNFSFGGNFSQYNFYSTSFVDGQVPTVTFGLDTSDPASALFATAKFPGASSAQITQARNIYAVLTGRLTSVTARAFLDETTLKYQYMGKFTERLQQREFGFFASDAWRLRPNLTVNYGLRWEAPYPFTTKNTVYSQASGAGLFGVSGEGNLFKPGTLTGKTTTFDQFKQGDYAYNTHNANFAPSFGIAWTPHSESKLLGGLLGKSGQTVLRAGYSVAFTREGSSVASTSFTANPGGTVNLARTISTGNLTPGQLFRDRAALAPSAFPSTVTYPVTGVSTDSVNIFDPNLKVGNVKSWSFGLQREFLKDNVIEIRYVGTRGKDLWRRYDLNADINTIENKFLDEFKLAQANLQANIAGGKGATFAYTGISGTSPLPIMLAYLNGKPVSQAGNVANYTGTSFTDTTFVNPLSPFNANPQGFASNLNSNATRRANAAAAGLPSNFFVVNPDYLGGAWRVDNSGTSFYDALTIELRRRFAKGLLVQSSYTFSKSLTNMFASNNDVESQPVSLRTAQAKSYGPFDLTHGFKVNWVYELPFGHGKALLGNANRALDQIVGGWEFHGIGRVQSGTAFSIGNVSLVGMTPQELDKLVEIRKGAAAVFYLPDDVILNTRRAFNVTSIGYSALGAPDANSRYLAPAGSGGCVPGYTGQCGYSNVVLHGPRFTRFDLSAIKHFKVTERLNVEFRAEFLNVFNNINFKIGSPTSDVINISNFSSATFGQTTFAYQDNSTTNDPGGRLMQFVLRVNF